MREVIKTATSLAEVLSFGKIRSDGCKRSDTTETAYLVLHGKSLVNFSTKVFPEVLKGILLPSMFAELQSTRMRRDEVPIAITSVLSTFNTNLLLFLQDKTSSIHV